MPQRTIKLTVRVVARAEQPSPDLAESSSATQRALAPAIEPARSDGARASESSIRSVQVFTLEPGEELEFAVEELASAGAQHDGASDGAEQHAASSKAEHVVWRSDGEAARHHAHFASFSHYHARGNTHESGGSVHTTDFDDTSEAACLQSLLAGPSRSHTTSAAHQTAIATSSSHRNRAPEHSRASSDLSWQELVSEMSAVALAEGIEGPTPLWQVNGGPAVARAPRIAYRSRTPRERFERGWWSVTKMLREAGVDQRYAEQLENNRLDRYLDLRERGFPGGYRHCTISAYLDDIDAVNALI